MIRHNKIIAVELAFIILALIFLFFQSQFCGFRSKAIDFMSLPLKLIYYPFSELKAVLSYRATRRENIRLKKELGQLKYRQIQWQEQMREDERLDQILFFTKKRHLDCITARVIGRDPSNWFFGVIIDKGRRDKVKLNAGVITPIGVVGKVLELGEATSKVILINDPNFKVAAVVQRSRQQGIVSGRLAGSVHMYYLDKDSDVVVGDKVITSGLSASFSKGFLIGEVRSVELDPRGLNKIAFIEPAINTSGLEEVLVILDE